MGVECGICLERCPFDIPMERGAAKMHADTRHRAAVALFEEQAA